MHLFCTGFFYCFDYAFVLTVPDENLCKQAFLIAACVLAVARLLRILCACVCVWAYASLCAPGALMVLRDFALWLTRFAHFMKNWALWREA